MTETPQVFDQVDQRIDDEEKFTDDQKDEFKQFFREYYAEITFQTSDVLLDRFFADNFRTISESDVEFNRADTLLYGENSKGKTSFIKSILYNIAGLPQNPSEFEMTRLITKERSALNTVGYWTIDDTPYTLERSLRQSGPGSSLSGNSEPYLSEDHTTEASISGKFTNPSEVLENFGLQTLKQRGHDPYEVLSLFFLMSEDFTRFLGEKHSELMDLLFGVNITTVMSAVENKIEELELNSVEEDSLQKLRRYESEKESLETRHNDLSYKLQTRVDELKEKEDELESLKEILSGEDKLDRLRSRRDDLRGRLADLKTERSEVVENLASVRRTIERYEDTELVEDMTGIADELRNFMTIPDRCPVCTNQVETDQREALLHDHSCPLCKKEMPDDRYRAEVEYEQSEDATATDGNRHQESLEELHSREQELIGEQNRLENQINSIEQQIADLSEDITDSNLSDLADEKDDLQKEVRTLRDETVDLQIQLESVEHKLDDVEYEIWANSHLLDIAREKNERRDAFRRLKSLIENARKRQREDVKKRVSKEMRDLFTHFSRGMLAEAHDVQFKSGGSYHFEIVTPEQNLDSSVADESTAEINLHAFLFHTAVLKLLSKSLNSLPLRLFVIDSPFANEVDEQNAKDISDFLTALPQILPDYQIVLASAETGSFDPDQYTENYDLVRFE